MKRDRCSECRSKLPKNTPSGQQPGLTFPGLCAVCHTKRAVAISVLDRLGRDIRQQMGAASRAEDYPTRARMDQGAWAFREAARVICMYTGVRFSTWHDNLLAQGHGAITEGDSAVLETRARDDLHQTIAGALHGSPGRRWCESRTPDDCKECNDDARVIVQLLRNTTIL